MTPVDDVVHVLPFEYDLGVIHDLAEFQTWLATEAPADDTDWRDARGGFLGFQTDDGVWKFVVHVPRGASPKLCAHEAVHAAWAMCECAGVELDAFDHEVLAYLVGFITEQLLASTRVEPDEEALAVTTGS